MAKARNILLVVDPASTEQPAVARGVAVARSLGLGLELLACAHEGHPTALPRSIDPRKARRAVLCSQLEKLRSLAQGCTGIEVTTKAVWDRPLHEAIIRETLRSEPRLVMKDSRFHSAISRALITNTDWHLIRDCPAPLLLVKDPTRLAAPRILVCVDPQHLHDKPAALDHQLLGSAALLHERLGGEVHALHVFALPHPVAVIGDAYVAATGMVPDEATLEVANRSLHDLLAAHPSFREHAHLRVGIPAQDIVSEALSLDADLLVMGAVSRRRLERWFIGNTAEAVLDRVPCNVWVEKPRAAA